jgi:hypothetical protein
LSPFHLIESSRQAVQDLYEIISEHYERGSLIITSNRAFEEWSEFFANGLLASAALDRLTRHAHTIVIRSAGSANVLAERILPRINHLSKPINSRILTPSTLLLVVLPMQLSLVNMGRLLTPFFL